MIIPRAPPNRRAVLRGLGTSLALPFLEAMRPSARGGHWLAAKAAFGVLHAQWHDDGRVSPCHRGLRFRAHANPRAASAVSPGFRGGQRAWPSAGGWHGRSACGPWPFVPGVSHRRAFPENRRAGYPLRRLDGSGVRRAFGRHGAWSWERWRRSPRSNWG